MTSQPLDQTASAWGSAALNYDLFAEQVTRSFADDAARVVRIDDGGEMSRILGLAMTAAFPDLLPSSAPQHWMELGEADGFCERLITNVFVRAHVVELRHAWVFDRIERFTESIPKVAPPMVAMFESMNADQRRIFLDTIANDFRTRQGDGPYAITHEALIAVGTKGT